MTEIMEKNGNLSFGIVSETTRPYVDQRGPEDVLLSFRYVLPWFGDRAVLDVGCSTGSYLALCPPGSANPLRAR